MKAALVDMMARTARTEAERYERCGNLTPLDRKIMKAYKSIAHGGKVIDLIKTFELGGYHGNGLPKLAICRADSTRMDLTTQYGRMTFVGNAGYFQKGVVTIPYRGPTSSANFTSWANTPYVPPYHRRKNMQNYFILWEATWMQRPSGDPFLLEHMGDNMYRIVAAWDITPLEAAVVGR